MLLVAHVDSSLVSYTGTDRRSVFRGVAGHGLRGAA